MRVETDTILTAILYDVFKIATSIKIALLNAEAISQMKNPAVAGFFILV
jgi:hypothetical protein